MNDKLKVQLAHMRHTFQLTDVQRALLSDNADHLNDEQLELAMRCGLFKPYSGDKTIEGAGVPRGWFRTELWSMGREALRRARLAASMTQDARHVGKLHGEVLTQLRAVGREAAQAVHDEMSRRDTRDYA